MQTFILLAFTTLCIRKPTEKCLNGKFKREVKGAARFEGRRKKSNNFSVREHWGLVGTMAKWRIADNI